MELFESLEIATFILTVAIILVCFYFAKQFGKGALTVPFVYFAAGTLLIGSARLFLFLAGAGVYELEEVTLHVWWHVMFYLGMSSFALGAMRIGRIAAQPFSTGFSGKDASTVIVFLLAAFAIFFVAPPMEKVLAPMLVGSFVDTFGLHHFLAVIAATVAGFYIYQIKTHWGKLLAVGVYPLLAFTLLMGLQHAWEVVTESWELIELPLTTIEQVEQFIVFLALLFLLAGFGRVVMALRRTSGHSP